MGYELNRGDVYGLAARTGAQTKEKGDELVFQYCPYCGGGQHRDKETFSVNLTTGAFCCLRSSCGRRGHFVELARDFGYPLNFQETIPPRSYRKFPQRPVEVRPPAIAYLESRKITAQIVRRYRITCQKDRPDILVFPFYDDKGQLVYVKYRNTNHQKGQGSKEWAEKNGKPILFGMDQCADFGRLVITEGQMDSLSLAQAGIKNPVSVPNGMNGFTWLDTCWDWVTRFQEAVVFGDCENGRITLLDTLRRRLPIRVKAVQVEDYLGEKDANDILKKYGEEALRRAVEGAKEVPIPRVKELADVQAVDIYSLPRVFTNLPELDRVIGGLYFGQVILLTGKRGEGKSTFLSQLMAEAIDQNYPVFAYSGELVDYHFKRWLDFQCAGPRWVRERLDRWGEKSYYLESEVIDKLDRWYRGRAYLYDNSSIDDGEEMEGLLTTIERVLQRYGVRVVCVDNLMTALDVGMKEDLYRAQSLFVRKLKLLAEQYNALVILVAHPRKTSGRIENDDVSGSSDITNRVDVVLSYSRAEGRSDCDSLLTVTKNRLSGRLLTGERAIKMVYSQSTKRISTLGRPEWNYSWETLEDKTDSEGDLLF